MSNAPTPQAPVATPATPAPAATSSWSVPDWMNAKKPDGTWNMAGLFFWLVMIAILVVLLNMYGLVHLWAVKKLDADGKGEDFYSDL
jgi:hypothetical protein